MSRYTGGLTRIIQAAGFNQQVLLQLLENFIENQCMQAEERGKSAGAESVCMGLHTGPPELRCGACVDAENNVPQILTVSAEIEAEAARRRNPNTGDDER